MNEGNDDPSQSQNDDEVEEIKDESPENQNRISSIDDFTLITLEQGYENSKGRNRFYTINVFCIIMAYSLGGLFPYSIPFLTKVPSLKCMSFTQNTWEGCDKDQACSSQFMDYKINHNSHETVTNWITSMDLLCKEDYVIGLFGSLYFVGFFIGSAFFLRFADLKGRRVMVIIGIIGSVCCGFLIFVINNIILTYLLMLVLGVFSSLRLLISFLYAMELVPEIQKKTWNLIAGFMDAITMIFVAGWFFIITYGESTIVLYIVTSCLSLYFVYKAPESPQYLYTKKKWGELHASFAQISKINGIEWNGYKFDREHLKENEFSIKKSCASMIKDKQTFRNLMIMMMNWSTCSFSFYLLSYYTKYFKGNIYSNTALLGLADIFATISMRGLQYYMPTKIGFVVSYCVVFVISCIYYIIQSQTVLVAICVLLMRYGVTVAFSFCYYGNSEYFQTDMSSTAFGVSNTMARFSTIVSPMVAEVLSQPIILVTLVTFGSAMVSFFLKKPQNILGIEDDEKNSQGEVPDAMREFYGIDPEGPMPKEERKSDLDHEDTREYEEPELEAKKSMKEKFVIESENDEDLDRI
ncbi:unnamed protein product [Moneuplotes crassus]|uniref:Uncharacterized protein n=1 Tax=Euplotes crassus TaxID=5936 RepID=A0AAD1X7K0_EUPCR|nr:unnamed protein product [Moneuplotes crassus]